MASNEDLAVFVRDALAEGVSRKEIEAVLGRAGWAAPQVQAALTAFADVEFSIPVPRPRSHLSARNAFMRLTLFAALYLSAYSLGFLLFQLINSAFPDPAMPMPPHVDDEMRWAAASLIVAVPVFLSLSRLTDRQRRSDATERGSQDRRWLTYLTLFVAALVVIGDVITLIYNGLGGELTMRLVLKGLTVGAIAGSVFGYYLWDIKVDESGTQR